MLKRLFRWILRATLILVALILIAQIWDWYSHRVTPNSVLVVTIDGPVIERGRSGLAGLVGGGAQTPLNVIRQAVHNATDDPRIVGLAIRVIDPQMELAQAQELSGLIGGFAGKKKWSAAYLETAGESEPGNLPYLVAAAAQEVSMMPQGELNLVGISMRELFLRGALDWIGVQPNFEAMGTYKSAPNTFTEKDFTAPQREQDEALVSNLFDQLCSQVASERRIPSGQVRELVNQAPLTPDAGVQAHLIDRLEYEDQYLERIKHYAGGEHALVDYRQYARPRLANSFEQREQIAVIYGSGAIQRGSGGFDPLDPGTPSMASDRIAEAFQQAGDNDSVRAVIFRIDSPGGSVLGSELIRRAVQVCAHKKPVVVSMSGYAASGGYWVATPASKIIADNGTITGSIGVFSGKFNLAPAAAKLGINSGAISRGANVSMYDSFTDFTPDQEKLIRDQILGDTYSYFLSLVARSRHLTTAQVDQVAQGRVWTGEQALTNKLVDSIGGFDAALAEAKAQAKLAPTTPVALLELPQPPGLLDQLRTGAIDGRAMSSMRAGAWAEPALAILRAAIESRGAFDAAYCRIVPVM